MLAKFVLLLLTKLPTVADTGNGKNRRESTAQETSPGKRSS